MVEIRDTTPMNTRKHKTNFNDVRIIKKEDTVKAFSMNLLKTERQTQILTGRMVIGNF